MLLSIQSDFKVVGQAVNGLEAVALAERLRPDVAIVDMLMPGLSGMDVTIQIKRRLPKCHVIILSMHDDESYVKNALLNGAGGYVLKEESTFDLVLAVRTVIEGKHFLSPKLNERAIGSYILHKQNEPNNQYNTLTQREREVLHLSAEGLTGLVIAKKLSISVRMVETHRANLMHKLDLHSQADLGTYARKQGII